MSDNFARIAVRADGGLILGKNFNVLKPGKVYEIREFLGEFTLAEVGDSSANDNASYPNWNNDINTLATSRNCLLTKEEVRIRTVVRESEEKVKKAFGG